MIDSLNSINHKWAKGTYQSIKWSLQAQNLPVEQVASVDQHVQPPIVLDIRETIHIDMLSFTRETTIAAKS